MNVLELCGVKKGVNERINVSTLRWFGHVERMDDSRLVKRMYSGECVGNRPDGRPKKKWIESENECLEEREKRCIIGVNALVLLWGMVVAHFGQGMNPTLTRCHSEGLSQSCEGPGWIF